MPELPQMQALAERLDAVLRGRSIERIDVIGFASLKTVQPTPDDLRGTTIAAVSRRGKYIVIELDGGRRVLVHLSQAGRVDVEDPPKQTRGRGGALRLRIAGGPAVFVREHGTERKASWWILESGDDGPLARLGPEPDASAFEELVLRGDDRRRLHTILRDQHTVAGIGRGYADDALWRAELSPYATLAASSPDARARLLVAVRDVLSDGLAHERERRGGLSEPRLGGHFEVHGRHGNPCPRCATVLRRVSYESYEVTYCPACQTGGQVLADRRLSRLLK